MTEFTFFDVLNMSDEERGMAIGMARIRDRVTRKLIKEGFVPATAALGADGETLEAVLEQTEHDLDILCP